MSVFDGINSRCEEHQRVIVSRDRRSRCTHILNNINGNNAMRQYKLDEDVFPRQVCCDYLVLNDTLHNAYFIELKGKDSVHGIEQLKAAEELLQSELVAYKKLFRLVFKGKGGNVHNLRASNVSRIIDSWHGHFIARNTQYEENC